MPPSPRSYSAMSGTRAVLLVLLCCAPNFVRPAASVGVYRNTRIRSSSGNNAVPMSIAERSPGSEQARNSPNDHAISQIRVVDGVFYPYSVAGIQHCIDDAKTLGTATGICDARTVPSLSLGPTELDVGDDSGSRVMLLLPVSATWTTGIADGKSCAIKQFDKSMIIGSSTSGTPGFVLAPVGPSTNAFALYCTSQSPPDSGQYIHAEGFGVINTVGATLRGVPSLPSIFLMARSSGISM